MIEYILIILIVFSYHTNTLENEINKLKIDITKLKSKVEDLEDSNTSHPLKWGALR